MGPFALFDKSFLQSLSVDESVWFAHFFLPVVCPLFYVETLADLDKANRSGKTPEEVVGTIAIKFPETDGSPCAYHAQMVIGDLLGHHVPLNAQIPRVGGRRVQRDGAIGIIFDESLEAQAFSRWRDRKFLEIERGMARVWRAGLATLDLHVIAEGVRALGIDSTTCKTLEQALQLADVFLEMREKPYERIDLAVGMLSIPREYERDIRERFSIAGYPALTTYAPYAAHVMRVQLFFQFAMAAHLISSDRPSHLIDMAYLYYLPFCHMFVSWDKIHRTCAPLFLRPNQSFVWGEDLKRDLRLINDHFAEYPDAIKDQGIMSFAHAPPKNEGSLVRQLRAKYLGPEYDDRPPVQIPDAASDVGITISDLLRWNKAEPAGPELLGEDVQVVSEERKVRIRKGSWYQLPKDTPLKPSSEGESDD